MHPQANDDAQFLAHRLPDEKKKEYLLSLKEDEFRDKVVRELFKRMGLRHLRENCGADELGKDCIFVETDNLGRQNLIAIQTKRGAVTMAGTNPKDNLVQILTQIRMALDTPVLLDGENKKEKPLKAYFCTNGKVANSARQYLLEQSESNRVTLFGDDELIPLLDKWFPDVWLNINSNRFPYLQSLRRQLHAAEDVIRLSEVTGDPDNDSPIVDGNYVQLRLSRLSSKKITRSKPFELKTGKEITKVEQAHEPEFVDIAVEAIVDQAGKLSLITGEGGSGKTTCLRRLALSLVEKGLTERVAAIPVLLRAREIAKSKQPLFEMLACTTAETGNGESPFGSEDLAQGRVVVLVDALEEVDEKTRDRAVELIADFHETYPLCPVVVTSRDYRSILELKCLARFTHYWLLPVGLNELNGLVTRAATRRGIDSAIVKSTLRKLSDVHGVTLSPMLVTVFAASSDFTRQDIPPNIAEVFSKFTEQMIGRWDEKKGLSQQYEAKTKDFLLRRLAFEMHKERLRAMPVAAVEAMFADAIKKRGLTLDPKTVFDEVVVRSGLLRVEDGEVKWRHHLLQEYFAGRGAPSAGFFATVVHDEWWRTPMIFYFGNSPESFAELWQIIEKAALLPCAQMFDAAITIGLATQACYLAELPDKLRALGWVLEAFGISMQSFRKSVEESHSGLGCTLALCWMIALGRDAIGTRTLKDLPTVLEPTPAGVDGLFALRDPERVEAWRIVGLLEAGEFALASDRIKVFKTADRDLLFMVFVSAAWVLYIKDVPHGEAQTLSKQRDKLAAGLEDMRETLFRELKSVLFEVRNGRLTGVQPPHTSSAVEAKPEIVCDVAATHVDDKPAK